MAIEILDKHGWPVERIKGRPIMSFFRLLIHGRKLAVGERCEGCNIPSRNLQEDAGMNMLCDTCAKLPD